MTRRRSLAELATEDIPGQLALDPAVNVWEETYPGSGILRIRPEVLAARDRGEAPPPARPEDVQLTLDLAVQRVSVTTRRPPPHPRRYSPDPVWSRAGARSGLCADCVDAQAAAHTAGRAIPARRPTRWRLTTGTDSVLLCGPHAAGRGKGSEA